MFGRQMAGHDKARMSVIDLQHAGIKHIKCS